MNGYVGRLAPSPTGLLHLGHASTFLTAYERARDSGGRLLLRCDDLDHARCRAEYVCAMQEDMRWLGIKWEEPMYYQSERIPLYREALKQLYAIGVIYPCWRSRRDVAAASGAPHEENTGGEPLYPREFRPPAHARLPALDEAVGCNWRFRVPDGLTLSFTDGRLGRLSAVAGEDFGDFLVWRKDQLPSYQLACAVDDSQMGISEVVRGEDLTMSTFRQQLILKALGWRIPHYYHCALIKGSDGRRLSKRDGPEGLRSLRNKGVAPEGIRRYFNIV